MHAVILKSSCRYITVHGIHLKFSYSFFTNDLREYLKRLQLLIPVWNGQIIIIIFIFTALHGMQTRSSNENFVRLSVKRLHYDKMEENSVNIFIPYERPFSLIFREKEWLVGMTPSTWNFG